MLGESPSFTGEQERQRLLTALRESEILRELAELLASSLDLKRILQVLTQRTTEVCEIKRCSVWLSDDTREVFRPAAYYLSSSKLHPKSVKAADHIWQQGSVIFDDPEIYQLLKEKGMVVLDDLHSRVRIRIVAETFLVRSALIVALKREGRIVGMLSLDDPDQVRTFSSEQQQLARAIGQQAALAIDNAQLYQQAQTERKRAERLIERAQAINQVALTVNSGEDLAVVLEIATHHLVRGLNATCGAIIVLENDTLRLVSHTQQMETFSLSETLGESGVRLSDLPSCSEAATKGTPLFITAKHIAESERQLYRQLGLDNVMIVPLMVGTSHTTSPTPPAPPTSHRAHCVGFAFVNYQDANYFPGKGQFAFAQDIAAQCAMAIEKARLLADVQQAAALATERANTLDAVFQAMTEGITVMNQDGQVLVRNNAASQFLGVPINATDQLKAFLKRYPTYTLHGQPLTEEDFPLTRALKGERIRGERFVTTRRDGDERVLEVNVTQMLDDMKKQIGLVSAFRDVTEQTRAERRIRQALETMLNVAETVSGITEIKDILHSVLEMALSTLNCDRGMVQVYDEEQQVFIPLLSSGFADDEAEVEWLREQKLWLSPDSNQYQGFRRQLIEGHATVINAEQYPHQPNPFSQTMVLAAPITHNHRLLGLMMLDRSPACQMNVFLKREPQSPLSEFTVWDMAVIEGIAQLAGLAIEQVRWQQEATNARTNEAAMREANALKDEFLAITAHEFRTPLTVILAHSQVALRQLRRMDNNEEPIQRLNDSLATIEEQTHQLTNIVNTFLEVTQINRGQLIIKSESVDISEIAQQVVTASSATSAQHSISCNIAPAEHPYLVIGDSSRLSQIFGNLIQNAIKYSPLGGPIIVSLRQYRSDAESTIEVCITDKGIGIPKEALPRLFERFYRAPNIQSTKTKGIGLGLYLVAELLHMHGGTIRAESSGVFSEGSRFIFTLPALESDIDQSDRTTELAS
jgi:PAS domain S-box-containing protein